MKELILNQAIVVIHIHQKFLSQDLSAGPLTGMLRRGQNSTSNGGGLDQGLVRESIPMMTGGQSLRLNKDLHKGHRGGDQEKDGDKNMARNLIQNQDQREKGNQNLKLAIALGRYRT